MIVYTFANDFDNPDQTLPNLEEEKHRLGTIFGTTQVGVIGMEASSVNEKLSQRLSEHDKRLKIFHFSGHGSQGHIKGEKSNPMQDHALADILSGKENLHLVVLNACHTWSLVERLSEKRIKAVIATKGVVGDENAKDFAVAFYNALIKNRKTLKEAFTAGLFAASALEEEDQEAHKFFYKVQYEETYDKVLDANHQSKQQTITYKYSDLEDESSRGLYYKKEHLSDFVNNWGLYYIEESTLNWKYFEIDEQDEIYHNTFCESDSKAIKILYLGDRYFKAVKATYTTQIQSNEFIFSHFILEDLRNKSINLITALNRADIIIVVLEDIISDEIFRSNESNWIYKTLSQSTPYLIVVNDDCPIETLELFETKLGAAQLEIVPNRELRNITGKIGVKDLCKDAPIKPPGIICQYIERNIQKINDDQLAIIEALQELDLDIQQSILSDIKSNEQLSNCHKYFFILQGNNKSGLELLVQKVTEQFKIKEDNSFGIQAKSQGVEIDSKNKLYEALLLRFKGDPKRKQELSQIEKENLRIFLIKDLSDKLQISPLCIILDNIFDFLAPKDVFDYISELLENMINSSLEEISIPNCFLVIAINKGEVIDEKLFSGYKNSIYCQVFPSISFLNVSAYKSWYIKKKSIPHKHKSKIEPKLLAIQENESLFLNTIFENILSKLNLSSLLDKLIPKYIK